MGLVATLQRLFTSKTEADQSPPESFDARRAFGVEPDGDEGPSYFIELTDRRVLFVSGRYLQTARPFPCTSFAIRRHRGRVVELTCRGDVLEAEAMTLPFTRSERKQKKVPKDGDVITGKPFDAIKSERLAAAFLSCE